MSAESEAQDALDLDTLAAMDDEYDALSEPHIIVVGNPVDGFGFIGPYPDHQAALTAAESGAVNAADWWLAPLATP